MRSLFYFSKNKGKYAVSKALKACSLINSLIFVPLKPIKISAKNTN